MEKVPQKLDKTRAEYYKGAPIAKFGERPAPTRAWAGRSRTPTRTPARWSAWKPAGRLTAFSAVR